MHYFFYSSEGAAWGVGIFSAIILLGIALAAWIAKRVEESYRQQSKNEKRLTTIEVKQDAGQQIIEKEIIGVKDGLMQQNLLVQQALDTHERRFEKIEERQSKTDERHYEFVNRVLEHLGLSKVK